MTNGTAFYLFISMICKNKDHPKSCGQLNLTLPPIDVGSLILPSLLSVLLPSVSPSAYFFNFFPPLFLSSSLFSFLSSLLSSSRPSFHPALHIKLQYFSAGVRSGYP